jgi:hypothetical protein
LYNLLSFCTLLIQKFPIYVPRAYANELKASSDGQHEHSTTVYLLCHAKETRTINVLGEATTAYNVEWSGNTVNITSTDGSTVGSNYNDACGDSSCAEELRIEFPWSIKSRITWWMVT